MPKRPIDIALEIADEQELGKSQLAKRIGVDPQTITNWIARGMPPKDHERVADALGVPISRLLGRNDEADGEISPERYAKIRNYAVTASAGSSSVVEHEVVQNELAFRRDWLTTHGLSSLTCVSVTVKGDSMLPTLSHGDTILVDTGDKRFVDGRIYLFLHDEGPRVKRLVSRIGGGFIAASDNPDKTRFRDEAVTDGMQVAMIGRVVYRSGLV